MLKQDYYNEFFDLGQQKINFSFFELHFPEDDPVYTLKKVMEELPAGGRQPVCGLRHRRYQDRGDHQGHCPVPHRRAGGAAFFIPPTHIRPDFGQFP